MPPDATDNDFSDVKVRCKKHCERCQRNCMSNFTQQKNVIFTEMNWDSFPTSVTHQIILVVGHGMYILINLYSTVQPALP